MSDPEDAAPPPQKGTLTGFLLDQSPFTLPIETRPLMLWVLFWFVVGSFGTWSAYYCFDSDAWRSWSALGPKATVGLDILRLAASFGALVFALWNMRVFPEARVAKDEIPLWAPFSQVEKRATVVVALVLLLFASYFLRKWFVEELVARRYAGAYTLDNIARPYLTYLLYIASLWIGAGAPLLHQLVRCIRSDWKNAVLARGPLDALLPQKFVTPPSAGDLTSVEAGALDNAQRLKAVAERYIPVAFAVAMPLSLQGLTNLSRTTTEAGSDWGLLILWCLLCPVIALSLGWLAFDYQTLRTRVLRYLRQATAAVMVAPGDQGALLDRFNAVRAEWLWKRSTVAFLGEIVKSAGIATPLLIALFLALWSATDHKLELTSLLLPRPFRDALKDFLGVVTR